MTTVKSLGSVKVLGGVEEFAFVEALGSRRGGHVCATWQRLKPMSFEVNLAHLVKSNNFAIVQQKKKTH
jgi:hypothetical protein